MALSLSSTSFLYFSIFVHFLYCCSVLLSELLRCYSGSTIPIGSLHPIFVLDLSHDILPELY